MKFPQLQLLNPVSTAFLPGSSKILLKGCVLCAGKVGLLLSQLNTMTDCHIRIRMEARRSMNR